MVDNHSTDGSVESVRRDFPQVKLLCLPENKGFAAGVNQGAEVANGDFFFFLNNDAFLLEDSPKILAELMQADRSIGVCGPKLIGGEGSFQLSFGFDPSPISEWKLRKMHKRLRAGDRSFSIKLESRYSRETEVDWVTGGALMVRKETFRRVGGFDETFFMYFEDADFCRRIRQLGLKTLYVPTSKVVHIGGQSKRDGGAEIAIEYRRGQLHYYRKHWNAATLFLLRVFLICKFSLQWTISLGGAAGQRKVAGEVIKLALRSA